MQVRGSGKPVRAGRCGENVCPGSAVPKPGRGRLWYGMNQTLLSQPMTIPRARKFWSSKGPSQTSMETGMLERICLIPKDSAVNLRRYDLRTIVAAQVHLAIKKKAGAGA